MSLSKPAQSCILWWSEEIQELVEEVRRAFRRNKIYPSQPAEQKYVKAIRAKGTAISTAKRHWFLEAIQKVCKEEATSFWRLAKWAQSKSFLPPTPHLIPSLTTP
jgi:hypothetical protein